MHDVHNEHGCFREDKFHLEPLVWLVVFSRLLLSQHLALSPAAIFGTFPCAWFPDPTPHFPRLGPSVGWREMLSILVCYIGSGTDDQVVDGFKLVLLTE